MISGTTTTTQVAVSALKRKRSQENSSAENVDSYKCSFAGICTVETQKKMLTCAGPTHDPVASPFIEYLPYETFLHIVSFLGPSTALTSMSCVNRRYNRFMRRIGDIMLNKANKCFRQPLGRTLHTTAESSISVFVRYAFYCGRVNDRLGTLNCLLSSRKISSEEQPFKRLRSTPEGTCSYRCHPRPLAESLLYASNVDTALDVAHDLVSELSNAISYPDRHMACSHALESKVLATVGKVGGLVFKQSKGALALLQQDSIGEDNDINERSRADEGYKEIEKQISLDMKRIDKARVLMQKVVFYMLLLECRNKTHSR